MRDALFDGRQLLRRRLGGVSLGMGSDTKTAHTCRVERALDEREVELLLTLGSSEAMPLGASESRLEGMRAVAVTGQTRQASVQ